MLWASLIAELVKNLPALRETWVWFLGWEWALGEGNSYPLQYFSLENSMDCIVPGVTKSQTWLSDFHFLVSEIYRLISIVFACIYMCVTCLHVCVSCIICENWNMSDVYIFRPKEYDILFTWSSVFHTLLFVRWNLNYFWNKATRTFNLMFILGCCCFETPWTVAHQAPLSMGCCMVWYHLTMVNMKNNTIQPSYLTCAILR